MDSSDLRKQLNEYLFHEVPYEFATDENEDKISEDWPWHLEYKGYWSIPNANDTNDAVDIYSFHYGPELDGYVYATKHSSGGDDEVKGRSVEDYIKEEWDVEPKRLDQ